MSVTVDDMENATSYGDFRHETYEITTTNNADTNGQNSFSNVQFDPFTDSGGLDNDEIAELVGFYATVNVKKDPAGGTGDALLEYRGVFGANLTDTDLTSGAPNDTDAFDDANRILIEDADIGGTSGNAFTEVKGGQDEQGTFLQWDIVADAAGDNVVYTRHLREDYGRGPVMDATDDLNVIVALIREDGTSVAAEANIQLHLIWDVAVVEGVRNRFSLPEGFR